MVGWNSVLIGLNQMSRRDEKLVNMKISKYTA
jgi:hypothetical protein